MLKKLKRCLAAFLTAAVTVSCVGCGTGESTAYAMTIDGVQVKAGIYILYQNLALEEAKSLAQSENADIDTTDEDALEGTMIEGKKFLDWVHEKTLESCKEHVAVIKKFDEMKLELEDDMVENADDYAASVYEDTSNNKYYLNGIGEESFKEFLLNSYKSSELFDAIYGEGGTENIQETEIKDYYIENNSRVKYVDIDLHDTEGNELDDAGKKEMKDMANKFLSTVKNTSSEEDMLIKFNDIQDEYDEYVSKKTAEASGGDTETPTEAVTTTTAAETETDTTTTTTTTNPYANESIIPVVTTNEDTNEDEVSYYPSKELYEWVYNPATKTGVPEIIENENTIYIAVKLDITKRLTDDDLWNETTISNQRFSKYSKDMQNKIDEWAKLLNVDVNEAAVKRYDPFDFKEPETTKAAAAY